MKSLVFLPLFLSLFLLPSELCAAPKAAEAKTADKAKTLKTQKTRTPANSGGYQKAITFQCKANSEEPRSRVNVLGSATLMPDGSSPNVGVFSLNLYLRTKASPYPKSLTGTYTTVPSGYVLRAEWLNSNGKFVLIHLHPKDLTGFPGLGSRQFCEVTSRIDPAAPADQDFEE